MNLRIITRPARLGTAEFAAALQSAGHCIQPQSIRRYLCEKGHYLGERPVKMPNGRLLWDAAAVKRLTTPQERGAGK
ncbi:MAG: DNA-binding protein [Zoogloea oleivorans]|jgi:hypothetical protein|uniref:DNA-binding protein n=1 Tax=Zoogloea oleivorans TaxID=1552750 RepID=UPI002A35A133|nr:DNA-binding protein [Zoogloea oleivorans]MDY0037024.1 DNA-binding protein [Zoogloea oleivorans]